MKKPTHYLPRILSILGVKGVAACGIYVSHALYGDNITWDRQDVTCGNCKRTRMFKEPGNQDSRNQQRCGRCNRIVGCDVHGRKHKCDCAGAFIAVPDDRK